MLSLKEIIAILDDLKLHWAKEQYISKLKLFRGDLKGRRATKEARATLYFAFAFKHYSEFLKEEFFMQEKKKQQDHVILSIYTDTKNFENGISRKHFYTYLKCFVEGEENKGWQRKSFNVIFDRSIDTSKFKDGVLIVDKNIVKIPKWWSCQKLENGKKKYPYIYINEMISYYNTEQEEQKCLEN